MNYVATYLVGMALIALIASILILKFAHFEDDDE
jgi:hypothetical protein